MMHDVQLITPVMTTTCSPGPMDPIGFQGRRPRLSAEGLKPVYLGRPGTDFFLQWASIWFPVRSSSTQHRVQNEDFAFVKEKGSAGKFLCDVISQRTMSNVFEHPCNSKLLNIAFVQNLTDRTRQRLLETQNLNRKVVCLPDCKGYALFPLLHQVERQRLAVERNFNPAPKGIPAPKIQEPEVRFLIKPYSS